MKFIVTPMYYIDNRFAELLKTTASEGHEICIIITDEVSPVFPIDTRLDWLNKTPMDVVFTLDSMIQNDESEEFLEALQTKLAKEYPDATHDVVMLATEHCHENVKEAYPDYIEIKSPLVVRKKHLFPVFATRFGHQFEKFTKPKNKELPSNEEISIIPYFIHDGKEYFGFAYLYPTETLSELWAETSYLPPVSELEAVVKVYTRHFTGEEALEQRILGWTTRKHVAVLINKPEGIDVDSGNLTGYVMPEMDLMFISKDSLLMSNTPLFHWISNKFYEVQDDVVPEDLAL